MVGLFIVLAIIMGCISIPWMISSNSNASAAADELGAAKSRLSSLCWNYNSIQRKLEKTLAEDAEDTGKNAAEVAELLKNCEKAIKDIQAQESVCRQKQHAAYDALESHRRYQNFMGGGANDLTALLYYKNERKYADASFRSASISVDHVLLQRAVVYVQRHRDGIKEADGTLPAKPIEASSRSAAANSGGIAAGNSGNTEAGRVKADSGRAAAVETGKRSAAEADQTSAAGTETIKKALDKAEAAGCGKKQAVKKKKHRLIKLTAVLGGAAAVYVLVSAIGGKSWDEMTSPVTEAAHKVNELLSVEIKGAGSIKTGSGSANAESNESKETADITAEKSRNIYITKANVNLRTEPSSDGGDATVICTIPAGTECIRLAGLSKDGNWIRLRYDGQTKKSGWASLSYLEKITVSGKTAADGMADSSVSSEPEASYGNYHSGLQDSIDYWTSEAGRQQMQDSIDYWNSEAGRRQMQDSFDYWTSETGRQQMQDSFDQMNSAAWQQQAASAMNSFGW